MVDGFLDTVEGLIDKARICDETILDDLYNIIIEADIAFPLLNPELRKGAKAAIDDFKINCICNKR